LGLKIKNKLIDFAHDIIYCYIFWILPGKTYKFLWPVRPDGQYSSEPNKEWISWLNDNIGQQLYDWDIKFERALITEKEKFKIYIRVRAKHVDKMTMFILSMI
jgi:hypothetical protein